MGKLRKNHVKRIYKKTYEKSPSVAKILKTVLTTSFRYSLRYGYLDEDYVTGLKWNRVIKKLSKSGQKKALTNSGKEIYVRGYKKFMEKIFRRNMILIPLVCHGKNSGVKVLEGNYYDKLRQSSAIGLVGYYNFTTLEETKIRSA